MTWDWEYVYSFMPMLLQGALITLYATALGSAIALVLGMVWAIARRSIPSPLSAILTFVLDFVRGTPLLVQLYLAFFVLPDFGILIPAFACGVIMIGLHYSTYTAEVYRAGIDNIPSEQWDASVACNFRPHQTWRYIIIPQVIRPMIPPLGNYVIAMFKETPLLSAITVIELMGEARIIANASYRFLEPMTMVGVVFLAISLPAAAALRWIEQMQKT